MSDFVVKPGQPIPSLGNLVVNDPSIKVSQAIPGGPVTIIGGTGGANISVSSTTTIPFTVRTGSSSDNISLGLGADNIFSGSGADIINAGGGSDIVDPGSGRNTVNLGAGADNLIVGADAQKLTKSTITLITDFSHADDTVTLSKSLLKGSKFKGGVLKKPSFRSVKNIKTIGANEKPIVVYEQKTGIVYYDPIKGKNQPLVQLPANQKTISANDFTIF